MENILISFTAETGALDEINQKLATVKQNMAGIVTGSGGSSTAGASSTAKGTTENSEKQRLDETRKATSLLIADNKKLMKDYDDLSKKYQASQSTIKASATDTKKSIDALGNAQKNVNAQIGNKAATESFREQMKKLKYEIIALDMAGQNGTETYAKLVQKAGEMNDAMKDSSAAISNAGSDTQAFDAILAGTELVAGGFSVATGAAALFGVGGEDVARMQVRLQSAIAITTGLQSVGNAVQRDGALIQGIVKAQTYAGIVAKKLENSTTWAGVIAQKALNAAAMANPYLLMAMAIITVVGAIWAWNAGSDKQADNQKRINELELLRVQSLENMASRYKEAGADREKVITNELEVLKASGASQQELAKIEAKLMAEKMANAEGLAGQQAKEIEALDYNKKKVQDLEDALIALAKAKSDGKDDITFKAGVQIQNVEVGEDGQKQIQDQLDQLRPLVKLGMDAKEGLETVTQQKNVAAASDKVTALKNARSEASAVAEIRLIEARKGSAEELAAKIGSIEAQKRADLDNAKGVTSQINLIIAKAKKDEADARRAFALAGLNDEKALIESKISLSKKGSDEEFNNQGDLRKKQLDIELADINQSIPAKLALIDKYQSDIDQMNEDYNAKRSTSSLNADISLIESELANAKAGSNEEYQLRSELIDKKRALDAKGAEDTIVDEKERAAKIIDINAKAVKEMADLKYNKAIESIDKVSALETLWASQDYADGLTNKTQFEAEKLKIAKKALEDEIAVRGEFSKEAIDLEQQLVDQEISLAELKKEAKDEIIRMSFETVSMLGNAICDGEKQRLNQQLSDLDQYYTTDVEAAKKNKSLKLITEKEYNSKQLKIKQDIAKVDKKQATFNVMLNAAQAIMSIWAKWAAVPVLAAVMTGLVVAQTAIQLNSIKNQPIPKYAKGRKGSGSGSGEMAWVGEQGPEIMYVPNSASIIPAGKSNKLRDAIGIMRDYNIPAMPYISNKAMEEAKISNAGINYDLLARKIGEQMKQNLIIPKSIQRPVSINVDHSGTRVTDGDTTTHYRNRKYIGNV